MADSHQMFIGGEWVDASDGATRDIIGPHTGAVMASPAGAPDLPASTPCVLPRAAVMLGS